MTLNRKQPSQHMMSGRYSFWLLASLLSAVVSLAQAPSAPLPATIAAPDRAPDLPVNREYWNKPSLRDNELHAYAPVFGETDEFPEFTRELLRLQWRDADPIDLYIVRPAGITKPPVVLYLYGYPGEAVRFLNNELCKTVTKNGYAAVSFSSRMTGQRYHDVPMKQWFVSDLQQNLAGTTHDIQMVLNYLASRGDFDLGRVGIFGEGSGGTIALVAASVDSRIKAVDVLNPWGDWPSWLSKSAVVPNAERANFLQQDFLDAIRAYDPVHVLPTLTDVPVRIQQNLWDTARVPEASREAMAKAKPANAELALYKDEQDYYERVGHNGKMLDWMYAQLAARRTTGTPRP